ncbi:MAG: cationic peptide transport system permease protein, partial [Alteromonadaceae bacterium]
MILLTIVSFSLSFLFPGDSLINLSGHINTTPEQLKDLSQEYQTKNSIFIQYYAYLGHILSGDLGLSMSSQTPINTEIANLLPATIELSMVALFLSMVIGIPLGFIAAIKHNKTADNVILSFAMIG